MPAPFFGHVSSVTPYTSVHDKNRRVSFGSRLVANNDGTITRPHGLGLASNGSLWFTGKLTNTVGRVDANGHVSHFEIPTLGAIPIYIAAGPDENMWCTELGGNCIARITPEGVVSEFPIPTSNCRPIAIVPSPDGQAMWFSEEAGGKVGGIDLKWQRH